MIAGKVGGLLSPVRVCYREAGSPPKFPALQICPTAANAAGCVSLPCVKGGYMAYVVTKGLSTTISQAILRRLRRDHGAAKASMKHPTERVIVGSQ